MSVYGSQILNERVDSNFTMGNLFEFIFESNTEIEVMFERFNVTETLSGIITESDYALAIPQEFKFDPEQVKKTLLEKIKEIWNKVITAVKTAINNVVEFIHKKYMETNLQDKFISKFSKNMTYDNLKKARENGWIGLAKNNPVIGKLADLKDSMFFKRILDDNQSGIDMDKDVEPIASASNYEEAKKIYDEYKKKLQEMKTKSMDSTLKISINNNFEFDPKKYFFIIYNDAIDENHYFPGLDGFVRTKKMAEEGQSMLKNYKNDATRLMGNVKIQKECDLSNMKSYKKGGSNESSDKEINQIMILYYKARYEFSATYIQKSVMALNAVMGILRRQHTVSMENYMRFAMAISKYVKVGKEA